MCFYLEQDRGHLLEEDIHKAEHRVAIRGNVSSFSMPWEDIMATLDPTHRTWESLPHSPATLQALVKITVKGMRYNEALEWVSGAKIRPWVVIALLQHLVDLGHPMCQDRDSPDQEKVRIAERVEAVYGKHETCPLLDPATLNRTNSSTDPPRATQIAVTATAAERRSAPAATACSVTVTLSATESRSGAQKRAHAEHPAAVFPEEPTQTAVTATVAERRSAPAATACSVTVALSATERRSGAQKRAHAEHPAAVFPEEPFASQLPSKHATPEVNIISCNLDGEAFGGRMRPSVLSADYASADVVDPEVALVDSPATTTHELGVQTGTDFWDQWRTRTRLPTKTQVPPGCRRTRLRARATPQTDDRSSGKLHSQLMGSSARSPSHHCKMCRSACPESFNPPVWESSETEIEIPGYDIRREITA